MKRFIPQSKKYNGLMVDVRHQYDFKIHTILYVHCTTVTQNVNKKN